MNYIQYIWRTLSLLYFRGLNIWNLQNKHYKVNETSPSPQATGGIPVDRGSDRPIIEKGPIDWGSDRPIIGKGPIDRGSDRPIIEKGPIDQGSDRLIIEKGLIDRGSYRRNVR